MINARTNRRQIERAKRILPRGSRPWAACAGSWLHDLLIELGLLQRSPIEKLQRRSSAPNCR
jgi:hypothetical protein